jgi:probable F420-dependent oxidoreductase
MRFHQAVTFLPTRQAVELAKAIDAQGYAGIYVSDHMFFPRELSSRYTYSKREDGMPFWSPETEWPDAWCFIAAMAAVTHTVRFTTGVYVAPARDIITVAKQIGTTAALSEGRVNLGVGVGWCEEEFVATGQDFHTRGKRLDEMIPALRELWKPGWVEHRGEHYDIPAMRMEPAPPAPIPIYGGGHSAPALRRAATLCDGWIAAGAYDAGTARTYLDALHEARLRAGREHEPFAIYLSLAVLPDIDLFRSFEEDYGVTDLLCAPWMGAGVTDADPPEEALRKWTDASARFAEEFVHTMR